MPRIYEQKSGKLTEADRLELLKLLGKAGYVVRIGREKKGGSGNGVFVYFVEFEGGGVDA